MCEEKSCDEPQECCEDARAVERRKLHEAVAKAYCDKDPWKHRASGMRCQTCMYYVAKAGAPVSSEKGSFGRCRRHAPTMNGYPACFGMDWCGDHKLDENKL